MTRHGGRRAGAGRPKGATSEKTKRRREAANGEGITPLEYMLKVMRDETAQQSERMDAAKASAPYVHARLAAIEHTGEMVQRVVSEKPMTADEWAERHADEE